MDQFDDVFRGIFGTIVPSDGTEAKLGNFTVKAVTDDEEGVDDFFVDGKLVEFPTSIDINVDFAKMELVCFKSNGYSGEGCYFSLGLLDGKVVLIDNVEGGIMGQ